MRDVYKIRLIIMLIIPKNALKKTESVSSNAEDVFK
jgi:hypothetical protein